VSRNRIKAILLSIILFEALVAFKAVLDIPEHGFWIPVIGMHIILCVVAVVVFTVIRVINLWDKN
jgi:hypothetical protein